MKELFTTHNFIAATAGLTLAICSWWEFFLSNFLTYVFFLLSGIGWWTILMLFTTVAIYVLGYVDGQIGDFAMRLHSRLHRHLTPRIGRAVSFILGIFVVATASVLTTQSINGRKVVLLSVMLMLAFTFYHYCLNAMADRLRIRGYLNQQE